MVSASVVLITGPAGSGKTSTARAWATAHPRTAAHLSVDEMSLVVKSGFVGGSGSTDEARRQWLLAVAATSSAASVYAAAGVACAVDAFVLPDHMALWDGVAGFDRRLVVLLPDVEVAVERNAHRLQHSGWGVPEQQVRDNHEAMNAWSKRGDVLIVDNAGLSVDDVVRTIGYG